nr:hypothetical protein [Halodesulfurarchaeum sp.]
MRLTSDTDREAVSAHLEAAAPDLRTSEARADRLQRDARIRTGQWDLVVQVETAHRPATIERGQDGPIVTLSGDPVGQPVTAYSDREWGLLVQRVRLLHEVIHLEFTDFADVHARLQDIENGHGPVAGALWNAVEDAAIEATIRDQWPNFGDWFRQVRTNLLYTAGPGIADPDGGLVYPLAQAAVLALMDGTVIEPGPLQWLRDSTEESHHFHTSADRDRFEADVLPPVRKTKQALHGVTNPVERNRLAFECFQAITSAIQDADADGRGQVAAWSGDCWGMPDDTGHDIEPGRFDPLPAVEIRQTRSEPLDHGHAIPQSATSTEPDRKTQPVSSDQSSESKPADPTDEDTQHQLADDLAAEIEAKRRDGETLDERTETLETLQAAVSATETELESEGVVIPEDDPAPHTPTEAAAKADGARLARVLRNRFQ